MNDDGLCGVVFSGLLGIPRRLESIEGIASAGKQTGQGIEATEIFWLNESAMQAACGWLGEAETVLLGLADYFVSGKQSTIGGGGV
jgi:hypothetical protein